MALVPTLVSLKCQPENRAFYFVDKRRPWRFWERGWCYFGRGMRGRLEKLQNVEKPIRRPFSNGGGRGRGTEGEERRQWAGVVSGDGLTVARRAPNFKDPWADSDGILGTRESWSGWLGRRRGRSEVRCSERGWKGQGLGGNDQLCLEVTGPQDSGSMCPTSRPTTTPGSLQPGCHMNGREACSLKISMKRKSEKHPRQSQRDVQRCFPVPKHTGGTWMWGQGDTLFEG